MFISGPKAAAAMSDKHSIIMYVSGRSLPTLEQSQKTEGKISLVSNNKISAPSPKMDTLKKAGEKSDSVKTMSIAKAEVLDQTLDCNVYFSRTLEGHSSHKRKLIVLDSDSDD
jgi:hypothetical protein